MQKESVWSQCHLFIFFLERILFYSLAHSYNIQKNATRIYKVLQTHLKYLQIQSFFFFLQPELVIISLPKINAAEKISLSQKNIL